jgi:predicted MPP superfamily phosphohydrolase
LTFDGKIVRWLHLSDFHVGKDDYATRKMFDYILEHVRDRKAKGFVPDLLFITGDLADKGLASQYETFWLEFVTPLQEVIGEGITGHTFAVPGNHDVDRNENEDFSREGFLKPSSHHFDPTAEGKRRRDILAPRFRAYSENDCTPVGKAFAEAEGAFAKTFEINGVQVGILCVNTAWLCKGEDDRHQLTPGKPLLEHALDSIKETTLRIVLGHHPINWLVDSQQKTITSLLGKHNVIYLHGHLHDSWVEPTAGGAGTFLAVQSGACFHVREGEKWRNGLVWGEADIDTAEIRLQPWQWTPNQQTWTLATESFHESYRSGDWWHYSLPRTPALPSTKLRRDTHHQAPKGWSVIDPKSLKDCFVSLSTEDAVRFFDGAVPDWKTALSQSIPRRAIVSQLACHFQHLNDASATVVALLLAAGCEGKTTAMLQSAYEVVGIGDNWRVLQRRDEAQPLVVEDILPVLSADFNWLILIDEADQVAKNLKDLIDRLPESLIGRVHCLLACRDTDWLASNADQLSWSKTTTLYKEQLMGLDLVDAEAIVKAWQAFGELGLGELVNVPESERANTLEKQAKEEAKTSRGAFFGALLTARNGTDLRKHVSLVLERLSQRKIPGGRTLLKALSYIAAMHAEQLEFLSRPVLASALGCPPDKLHGLVLVPLGQEAATTTSSSYVFTRHRRIAQSFVSVLKQEFREDIDGLYVELCKAALLAKEGNFIPEFAKWRFTIAEHFCTIGQTELAINLAKTVYDFEPNNQYTRTNLAKIYRLSDAPENATAVFRNSSILSDSDRIYYREWALAEGLCSHNTANVLLAAYSLCDQLNAPLVDIKIALPSLVGLCESWKRFYEDYGNTVFRDARMAAATVGEAMVLDPETKSGTYFEQHAQEAAAYGAARPDIRQAFQQIHDGIIAASQIWTDPTLDAFLPKAEQMTFTSLQSLVTHFQGRAKKSENA